MSLTRDALDLFLENRRPYLEEIIGLNFKEHPMKYSEFLNMKSAKTGWVDGNTVATFGLFEEKPELVDAATDDIIQGPTARMRVITYAKRHLVSQENIEDDMGDGIIASRVPEMAKAGRATMEVLGHDMLNSGFNGVGNSIVTPDNVDLFSASHLLIGGGTGSNLQTGDLSQTTLQQAITKLEGQKNDRGIPIMQKAQKLIFAPANKWNAQVILGTAQATGTQGSTSQPHDINPIYGMGLVPVESQFIEDDDSWFLLSDDHKLDWYTRIAPENWSEVDYRKSGVEIGARFRVGIAPWDWRGVVGSAGA